MGLLNVNLSGMTLQSYLLSISDHHYFAMHTRHASYTRDFKPFCGAGCGLIILSDFYNRDCMVHHAPLQGKKNFIPFQRLHF